MRRIQNISTDSLINAINFFFERKMEKNKT